MDFSMIGTKDMEERVADEGSVVVEVLSQQEYEKGHLPGAHNIPEDAPDFEERFRKLVPDTSTHVIVYCSDEDCKASPRAAKRLVGMGYRNVYDYEEGKRGWVEGGNHLTREQVATS